MRSCYLNAAAIANVVSCEMDMETLSFRLFRAARGAPFLFRMISISGIAYRPSNAFTTASFAANVPARCIAGSANEKQYSSSRDEKFLMRKGCFRFEMKGLKRDMSTISIPIDCIEFYCS